MPPPTRKAAGVSFGTSAVPEPKRTRPRRRVEHGLWGRWTYQYMNDIVVKSYGTELDPDSFFDVEKDDDANNLSDKLLNDWRAELAKAKAENRQPNIWRVALSVFGWAALWPGLAYFCESFVKIGEAYVLGLVLNWFQDLDAPKSDGYVYASILSALVIFHAVLHHVEFFLSMRLGMQMRVGFITAIYRKCLALSISNTSSTGLIVNLVSNDVQRFEDAAPFAHFIWLGPVEVLLIAYFMYLQIGLSFLAAMFAILALIPIQSLFARRFGQIRKRTVNVRDERIKTLSDAIAGMMVVKLYAWEKPFSKNVNSLRDEEMFWIRKASVLRAWNEAIYYCSSSVIELFAFITYWLAGGEFTSAKIFTCIVYMSVIKLSMTNFYPKALQFITESRVSLQRIQAFLSLPEITARRDPAVEAELLAQCGPEVDILIREGTFSWGVGIETAGVVAPMSKREKAALDAISGKNDTKPADVVVEVESADVETKNDRNVAADSNAGSTGKVILHDLDLTIATGELVAVIGPVGSGKSSLLHALLAETDSTPATRMAIRSRRVAFCTQTPFILSGTIRENITFGCELDEAWLREVISVCAMERDVELFDNGLDTVVGERGVTLSGGQRARLGLARAVYSRAELYLLDDPLSAVDTKVARHLFEKCIQGALKGRTVLLVTHQLQFARRCARVMLLEQGRVVGFGTHQEVLGLRGSKFAQAMVEMEGEAAKKGGEEEVDVDDLARPTEALGTEDRVAEAVVEEVKEVAVVEVTETAKVQGEGLIKAEQSAQGVVALRTYWDFFRAGASAAAFIIMVALLLLGEASRIGTDYWLARWSTKSPSDQRWIENVWIFLILGVGTLAISVGRAIMFFQLCLKSTEMIFRKMLSSTFRSPIGFFQSNPHGRLMNRFSKDLNLSDEMLPLTFFDFVQCFFMIIGTVVISVVFIPYVLVSVPVMGFLFYFLRKYYIAASRQIKRYESVTRSPVYSTVSATLEGLSTIRAYGNQEGFRQSFARIQNENTRVYFCFLSAARWLGLRLDVMSAMFLTLIAYVSVAAKGVSALGLNPGSVGLLLSYGLSLVGLFQWAVRQSAEVENLMVSVERILEYTKLEPEAPEHTDTVPPENWPTSGEVIMKSMSLTYPSAPRPVLNDINVNIPGGAKVGVVGRTGAGKSSLLQALFRLVEPSPAESVFIDGVPTSKLGLTDLRSRISIIPQESFCFKGTLRFNLDPFGRHDDAALWRALEGVELKHVVERMPEKMDSPVHENGGNWSAGERQLICLARAVLRDSKLIVMDEATSSVDMRTDALVQRAIRSEEGLFATSTVLTIAHRLQTIIDFDFVLVLDAGKVVEFGTPHSLLEKPIADNSAWFHRMVSEMGEESQQQLRKLAAEKDASKAFKAKME
ncbi:Multidrug resistance-associated protein 4 [Irineochytrium annulatum]|nr:Multidrug resistance-associated protein 4 [Irineochytrium annulatum]